MPCTLKLSLARVAILSKQHASTFLPNGIHVERLSADHGESYIRVKWGGGILDRGRKDSDQGNVMGGGKERRKLSEGAYKGEGSGKGTRGWRGRKEGEEVEREGEMEEEMKNKTKGGVEWAERGGRE